MEYFYFYLFVWTAVSLSNLTIGHGCLKAGNYLRPDGRVIRGIGWAFVLHGSFGLMTVIAALFRWYDGNNPMYQGIGYVAYIRTLIATLFWPGIAIAVQYVAHRLTKVDRQLVQRVHRVMFKLGEASKGNA